MIYNLTNNTNFWIILRGIFFFILSNAFWLTPSYAQGKKSYSYDARGRLVSVTTEEQGLDQIQISIEYDDADNRVRYQISNVPDNSGERPPADAETPVKPAYAVVPLNGYTVLPVR